MNYLRNITIFSSVLMTFFLCNIHCQTSGWKTQNENLPDLKIDNIHFEYLKRPKPERKPGMSRRTFIRPPYAIRFNISISNIGTENWNHDLYILYTFDENAPFKQDTIVIEDLIIPYALKGAVEIEVDYPSPRLRSITFYLNTTKADSIEHYRIYDEFYYRNNSFKVELN